MAQKMQNCGFTEEAVQQWSSVPDLAELSLYASPKDQKSPVRLSGLFLFPFAPISWSYCNFNFFSTFERGIWGLSFVQFSFIF